LFVTSDQADAIANDLVQHNLVDGKNLVVGEFSYSTEKIVVLLLNYIKKICIY